MSVYKKLTAQDIAVIPFNAHKQYEFTSGSAASNQVSHFNTQWTSESIDIYSSASTDSINFLKYKQLDHLYYRNFKRDLSNRFGDVDYLGQKRELYKQANILSIPAGLYGYQIYPGTFYLSSSIYKIVDDSKGNLIVSGTNLDDYMTDIRANVLNIGPIKGFERYDLNTYNNMVEGVFDKRGEKRVNTISSYSTPGKGDEFDDSYYFNIIKYTDVNFSEKAISPELIINGDFTNGSSGWTTNDSGDGNAVIIPGSFLCYNSGGGFGGGNLLQALTLTAGVKYVLTLDVTYISTSNYLTLYNYSDSQTFVLDNSLTSVGTYTHEFTSDGTGGIDIGVGVFNNGDSINISNLSLKEVDGPRVSQIDFNGNSSEVRIGNNEKYHFNPGDDFTLSLHAEVSHSANETTYLLSKSTTNTTVPSPIQGAEIYTTTTTGSSQAIDAPSEPQYPFEVYATGEEVFFGRSDGNIITTISSSFTTGSMQHITCRVSSSDMEIFINGVGSGISGSDNSISQTQNKANVYIGNKGGKSNYLSGSLSQINIFDEALSDTQVLNHYNSINGSPYVGNIFYSSGMVSITHPKYTTITSGSTGAGTIQNLKFQGSHMIWENEYQCTIDEHEFNDTCNISARKIRSNQSQELANFATGSLFKPYVTTVGLYNEDNELLVVGKLGQPVRCSDETDTTFILRWDT